MLLCVIKNAAKAVYANSDKQSMASVKIINKHQKHFFDFLSTQNKWKTDSKDMGILKNA